MLEMAGAMRDGDVAGDRDASGGGLGWVGLAGRGHLDFCALGKLRGGGVESIGGNDASLSGAAGETIDAPGDGSIRGVGDGSGKGECFTEEHASGSGRDCDGKLWWWRRRGQAATTSASAGGEEHTDSESGKRGREAAAVWRALGNSASFGSSLQKGLHDLCKCRTMASAGSALCAGSAEIE